MTFDIKVDGELQLDAFFHSLFQSRDLLTNKLGPSKKWKAHLHLAKVLNSKKIKNPFLKKITVNINQSHWCRRDSYLTPNILMIRLCPIYNNTLNSTIQSKATQQDDSLSYSYDLLDQTSSHLSRCLAAASNLRSSEKLILLSGPEPLVVRSTVSSCISMGIPSAENSRSNSTPVAPFLLA